MKFQICKHRDEGNDYINFEWHDLHNESQARILSYVEPWFCKFRSVPIISIIINNSEYIESVSKSFRTGHQELELKKIQLSAIRCSCIAILWVSLVSYASITLRVAYYCCLFRNRLSPGTFGYTLVNMPSTCRVFRCEESS